MRKGFLKLCKTLAYFPLITEGNKNKALKNRGAILTER